MIDANETVILVSETDAELGFAPKLDVHVSGDLHRAFSVFVLDDAGRLLLQRRAAGKYHSPGLWSNTCCGHPRPGERTADAARRRLREEMGIDCDLAPICSFVYSAPLQHGLVEHELDHVFTGITSSSPDEDPDEVEEWQWMPIREVTSWLEAEPAAFTAWFSPAFERLLTSART